MAILCLLPSLGETEDTKVWSDQQLITFAIYSYVVIAAYLACLALAMTNLFQFIFRTTQAIVN